MAVARSTKERGRMADERDDGEKRPRHASHHWWEFFPARSYPTVRTGANESIDLPAGRGRLAA